MLDQVDHRPYPLPSGRWVMHQSWYDFLLMHWALPPDAVRALVPEPLELDLWEGVAWVGMVPFRMEHVRPRYGFDVPGVASFLELNVRTYVRHRGIPGVYFLSLDCNHRPAVEVARWWFGLPYYRARMRHRRDGDRVQYESIRTDSRGREATYRGTHRAGGERIEVRPGSHEHWLIERYALFTVDARGVWQGDVHHAPWPVHRAEHALEEQTMLAAQGLQVDALRPDSALWSPGVDTVVWSPRKVG